MKDICVHTLTRDGQYIEPVITAVAPYVKRVLIFVDDKSKSDIYPKLYNLSATFWNVKVEKIHIADPYKDLIFARNLMRKATCEKWIWVIDDDEYWTKQVIDAIDFDENYKSLAFQCWAIWNFAKAHKASSLSWIPRIFRNNKHLEWRGEFTKEKLYDKEECLTDKDNPNLKLNPLRYIHLTHVKDEVWRQELHKERIADDRSLIPLSFEIIKTIKPILETYGYKKEMPRYLPNVRK